MYFYNLLDMNFYNHLCNVNILYEILYHSIKCIKDVLKKIKIIFFKINKLFNY